MTAPLSRYLTRFPTSSAEPLPPPAATVEPMVVLSPAELATRIEAAAEAGRQEMRDAQAADLADRESAAATALATARADWAVSEAEVLGARIGAGLDALQSLLADRIATVLRPLLAEAVAARTLAALREALARLLADAADRSIEISGPADLIAALQAGCSAPGIAWAVADDVEVTIVADATRIETCLGAALRALETTES